MEKNDTQHEQYVGSNMNSMRIRQNVWDALYA